MKLTKALYTPSEVAKIFRVSPDTIRVWIKEGVFGPDEIVTTPGGHRRVKREAIFRLLNERNVPVKKFTVIYARESSSHQKESLQRQVDMLIEWANKQGYSVDEIITDIASGMNFNRRGLKRLIDLAEQGILDTVIIAYKDRLARFGYDLIAYILEKNQAKIVVVNSVEDKPNSLQEIVDDFVSIIHYFAMRIYGARSYHKRLKKLKSYLLEEDRNETPSS